ncbi:uncharacterized protein LOC123011128 [Tribolium madens]|uniref:uncharacterized protein LOC123011128 n=1 Tax=Tribolium madens TaxID=41895 RepID=UPI001CF73B42|nr:uncharacterized protein LOC123011128 [Tribolium madens]
MFLFPKERKGLRPKTCWPKTPPFQTSLILILLVAAPFLIVMIILYAHSLTAWKQTEKCSTLCNLLQNWKVKRELSDPTDYPSFLEESIMHPDSERRKREAIAYLSVKYLAEQHRNGNEANYQKIEVHPQTSPVKNFVKTEGFPTLSNDKIKKSGQKEKNKELSLTLTVKLHSTTQEKDKKETMRNQNYFPIAALLEKIYSDENEELLKCTIAKLSSNWALTTTNCFKYKGDKWDFLSIRSHSDYWSKGGNINKIENVFSYKNLVALKLKSDQPSIHFYISNIANVSNREQIIFYWDVNLQLPLQKRLKFGKLQITHIPLKKTHDVPIFDSDKNLIGFQWSKFAYENVSEYRSWLKKLGAFP